jgi:hypothetical protein
MRAKEADRCVAGMVVTGTGVPPEAATAQSGPVTPARAIMSSAPGAPLSHPGVAKNAHRASGIVVVSFPPAKNPM